MRTVIALASLALAGCALRPAMQETLLSGQTMGSAWTVKIAGPLPAHADDLRAGVQARFDAVNLALSTYRADSALSRFNNASFLSGGMATLTRSVWNSPVCFSRFFKI